MTGPEAAEVMLKYGAVTFRELLSNDTITALRTYLDGKHDYRHELPYNENFWHDIGRLSLGLGTEDHESIGQALREIAQHDTLQTTLEGILGPNPALVEISTLTSLNGAEQQGIHTDSDWFGSSLLYSRTFYHSYSFFVALQDTPQKLGATTVCAGSHYCANEDLEAICVGDEDKLDRNYTETPAIEVSTNGHIGPERGLLRRGDGFLFHQNVWHRGPANRDEDGRDRIMFILTFVSSRQKKSSIREGDHRRQALGTYYYQRWNMWGHTWNDLLEAGRSTLAQPVAALRALGLHKPSQQDRVGITFIEQLCQQLANGEDFYADYMLEELRDNFWNRHGMPPFLQSKQETWKEYIPDILNIWLRFVGGLYCAGLVLMFCVGYPPRKRTLSKPQGPQGGGNWKRLAALHGVVVMSFVLFQVLVVGRSDLAKDLRSGHAAKRAFPDPNDHENDNPYRPKGPTTFPERSDVLISARFNADFLASYNRFMNYHPGNAKWLEFVKYWSQLPTRKLQQHAITEALKGPTNPTVSIFRIPLLKQSGMAARFLQQDYLTGSWHVMTQLEALEETKRAVWMQSHPLWASLETQAKQNLAQSRFGANRESALAKQFAQRSALEWLDRLWSASCEGGDDDDSQTTAILVPKQQRRTDEHSKTSSSTVRLCDTCNHSKQRSMFVVRHIIQPVPNHISLLPTPRTQQSPIPLASDLPWYEAGEKVYVLDEDSVMTTHSVQLVARIGESSSYGYLVRDSEDHDETEQNVGILLQQGNDDLQPFRPLQQGDAVEVDYHGNGEEYYRGRVIHVHPDGTATVDYFDDNEVQSGVDLDLIQPIMGPRWLR
mmetsp:Transcript_10289/g.28379  ORF Transcript_10289/g.28379 Transcript_10289/m.28379 type:complete len:831 (-) Transcript_10289:517-3009(-)